MADPCHGPPAPANFAQNLGYYAGVAMYFPAGIPLVALVALVIYNAHQEKKRSQAAAPGNGR